MRHIVQHKDRIMYPETENYFIVVDVSEPMHWVDYDQEPRFTCMATLFTDLPPLTAQYEMIIFFYISVHYRWKQIIRII